MAHQLQNRVSFHYHSTQCVSACRTGFARFRDSCYKMQPKALLYLPAKAMCTAMEAQHTSVADKAENQFLMDLKEKR